MRILLLFFLCHTACLYAHGQTFTPYQVINFNNGLPSNYVFAVCEDEEGFLWAGTDKGLCRYNGFSWQVWDKDNGLPGNYINSVLPDKKNGLWLNISEKGLYHFDIKTGKVVSVSLPGASMSQQTETMKDGKLFSMRSYNNVTTGYVLSPDQLSRPQEVFSFRHGSVKFIKPAPSEQCLYIVVTTKDTAPVLHHYTGRWKIKTKRIQPAEQFESIYFASDKVIVSNNGIIYLDNNGTSRRHTSLFNNNNTYAITTPFAEGYYISDIKTGYYFVSATGDTAFYNSNSGIGSNYVSQAYGSKDGTLILATLGAGLQLIKNNYRVSLHTDNREVRSIVRFNNSWVALIGQQVLQFDRNKPVRTIATVDNSSLNLYAYHNQILVGSLKGIQFYNMVKGGLKRNKFIPYNAGVSSMLALSENAFVGGSYGGGLISFTNRGLIGSNRAAMKIIEDVVPLSYGYAMLSYEDGIVLRHSNANTAVHLTQRDGLISNSVFHVHEKNDTLYIATKGGLNVYVKGRIVQVLGKNEGFTGNNAIYTFHDSLNHLWLVSDQCLHLLSGKRLQAITSHPLQAGKADRIATALYDEKTALLATGSLTAVSLVNIRKIQLDTVRTSPRLLQVLVNGKESSPTFKVPYAFQSIQFNFAPFALSPLAEGKLLYTLNSRKGQWEELHDSLAVSFAGLRPGNYTLHARVVNADGYSSPEYTLASFSVSKPFWQTVEFLMLVVLCAIAATIVIVRLRDRVQAKKRAAKLQLQQSLQMERQRISKDLHDHLGSNLATMIAQVDSIETKLHRSAVDEAATTVHHLGAQARQVMNVLRETIWAVQENEHTIEAFIIRMRTFLQRFYEYTPVQWEVVAHANGTLLLSPQQTLHLFRILQEASQNVLKHAQATRVLYCFSTVNNMLQLDISDNGRSSTHEKGLKESNGIANMKQRAAALKGTIEFKINPNGGVHIAIVLPL